MLVISSSLHEALVLRKVELPRPVVVEDVPEDVWRASDTFKAPLTFCYPLIVVVFIDDNFEILDRSLVNYASIKCKLRQFCAIDQFIITKTVTNLSKLIDNLLCYRLPRLQ